MAVAGAHLKLGVFTWFLASSAWCFTLETAVSAGCHERLTLDALARAGWPLGTLEPEATGVEFDLAANLPFHAPPAAGPWTLALLLGVRSNDLHGVAPTDFPEFAAAQLAEAAQEEHCLRTADEDFVAGDAVAVSRCRDFVVNRVALALGPLDALDLGDTENVRVALRYQQADLPLSRFAYRVGQALHAIQDSYTHTLRSSSSGAVLHVFNFVDPALRLDYSTARDGFGHVSKLDACESTTEAEHQRVESAIAASAALLEALSSAEGGRVGRLERAGVVAEAVTQYEPGCTPDNHWCDAAEVDSPHLGCSSAAGLSSFAFVLCVLQLLAPRRRAKRCPARVGWAKSSAVAAIIMLASAAQASDFSGYFGASASIDRAALAVDAGVRFLAHPRISLGVDVEFNPWFDVLSASAALGSFNGYARASYRWFDAGRFSLHTTLKGGASLLLFDVVGAHAGSMGLFFGASLLGASLELRPGLSFVIDPLEVDVAVPSLKGVPLAVRQYRLSVGLEQRF